MALNKNRQFCQPTTKTLSLRLFVRAARQFFAFIVVALLTPTLWAQQVPAEVSPSRQVSSLSAVETVPVAKMPYHDNVALLKRDLVRTKAEPQQFAEPNEVSITPFSGGKWETMKDGSEVWRLRIESEDALSLNFGFGSYWLPEGARLFISGDRESNTLRPYTSDDNEVHGQLWTPVVPGSSALIELVVPPGKKEDVQLELTRINHGYRPTFLDAETRKEFISEYGLLSGSCNLDVICGTADGFPEVEPFRDQIRAVAVYSLNGPTGSLSCTGALINNSAMDGKPYFLTANHCNVNAFNASSLVAYWNYENSICRAIGSTQSGNGTISRSLANEGSILRVNYEDSDVTLVEFDDPVNPAVNAYYAGWDRRDLAPTKATAIHHPSTDEKRISFSNRPLTIVAGNSSTTPVPGGSHLRIERWDVGTTEPGSSGSPLFNANGRIIGQLHGGDASCLMPEESDWFGRLATSWNGGGSPGNALKTWLDPLGSGVDFIDGTYGPSAAPNLTVEKSTPTQPVMEDSEVTYVLSVSNPSPVDAVDVSAFDEYAPGSMFVNGSSTCAAENMGTSVRFDLGTIGPGETKECTYKVAVGGFLAPRNLFFDDHELSASAWSWQTTDPTYRFDRRLNASNAYSGLYAWVASDPGSAVVQTLSLDNTVELSSNNVLAFHHSYNTESSFDGGVVEIKRPSDSQWIDVHNYTFRNGYPSALSADYGNPLGGRRAFSGNSEGYIETLVDLSAFSGQSILVRFRLASDTSVGGNGWYVDDVRIVDRLPYLYSTTCVTGTGLVGDTCIETETELATSTNTDSGAPSEIPDGYLLSSAYPNPFNPATQFVLEVDRAQNARVEVLDVLGRTVRILHDGAVAAHEAKSFHFNATGLPSGIYLYRVTGEYFTVTKKMMLVN